MQLVRAGMFTAVIWLIHHAHANRIAEQPPVDLADLPLADVQRVLPAAASLGEGGAEGTRQVLGKNEKTIGYVLTTSPASDDIIGFSGPTNVLIGFDSNDEVVDLAVLSSGDTKEHLLQVEQDDQFWSAFRGKTWDEVSDGVQVDATSGATLTSLAIAEGIFRRLGGSPPSLLFPEPLTLSQAQQLFADAKSIDQDPNHPALWQVTGPDGRPLGEILLTTPAAEQIIGFQGPTQTLIGFDPGGRVIGLAIGKTYDNEEGYVEYVRDEEYFLTLFNDKTLADLAKLDLLAPGEEVEGVSGATMTSMAVAEGLIAAADAHFKDAQRLADDATQESEPRQATFAWSWRDAGTGAVIAFGLLLGLTRLRSVRWLRFSFLLVLIGYLGLTNGDMVSQAMLAGWAKSGVPWRTAGGLVLLTAAAFAVPLLTRHNLYCSHLCPHGAVQQLVKNRLPWQLKLPKVAKRVLRFLPAALLGWCVLVAMLAWPYSLIDIEPFDAWVFRIAGVATIMVAVVGLVASLFVPMAYCRYGCPTGALLSWLRFNSRSDRFGRRDWLALGLVLLAAGCTLMG